MSDITLSDAECLQAAADDTDVALAMDEDAFRAFYERTAAGLWGYLSRISGDRQLADDLLQEAYYRLLRAGNRFESEAHRRNYLYRIATNLVRDGRRQRHPVRDEGVQLASLAADDRAPAQAERVADVRSAMRKLKPRERALLWLAYAQGSSHVEIAEVLGLRTASVKLLLFRARRRMAALLRGEQNTSGVRL
ncbi:MAG TPA: sigma-70 family RNA polymerase sigma factor [Vicinamibacterales bacterium]